LTDQRHRRTYPQGVPSWVDLLTDDLTGTAEFYGGLFGWEFAEVTPPGAPFRYAIATLDGRDAAGVGTPASGSGAASWLTYVAVDDAETMAAGVLDRGGAVLEGPADAGEGGRSVVCADPAGARFGLWQARKRLGAQVVNVPGAWNFSDLHTPDPGGFDGFYGDLFGWIAEDSGDATLIRQPGYGHHLQSTVDPEIYERQAGIGADPGFADAIAWLAAAPAGEPPHWQVSFTVTDRDGAARRAESLGGTVVATSEGEWTREALVRDPHGAVFTASQFAPPER
jgi:uncharacterized protein